MKLLRENTEIRSNTHSEGTSDYEPLELDIEQYLSHEGYYCDKIHIWYDDIPGFWRWNCKMEKS